MRFIQDCNKDYLNTEHITFVYRIDDDVYAHVLDFDQDDFCLYRGESHKDALEV